MMPRGEYDSKHEKIVADIESLKISRAEVEGKASQKSVNLAFLIAVTSLLLGIIVFFVDILKL
jgi:hypothetical protein